MGPQDGRHWPSRARSGRTTGGRWGRWCREEDWISRIPPSCQPPSPLPPPLRSCCSTLWPAPSSASRCLTHLAGCLAHLIRTMRKRPLKRMKALLQLLLQLLLPTCPNLLGRPGQWRVAAWQSRAGDAGARALCAFHHLTLGTSSTWSAR